MEKITPLYENCNVSCVIAADTHIDEKHPHPRLPQLLPGRALSDAAGAKNRQDAFIISGKAPERQYFSADIKGFRFVFMGSAGDGGEYPMIGKPQLARTLQLLRCKRQLCVTEESLSAHGVPRFQNAEPQKSEKNQSLTKSSEKSGVTMLQSLESKWISVTGNQRLFEEPYALTGHVRFRKGAEAVMPSVYSTTEYRVLTNI